MNYRIGSELTPSLICFSCTGGQPLFPFFVFYYYFVADVYS